MNSGPCSADDCSASFTDCHVHTEALKNDSKIAVEEKNITQIPVIVYPSQAVPTEKTAESDYCLTSGCVKAANKVMDRLDEAIDPCENFYEFACGKFLKETEIPGDKVTIDSFSITRDIVQEQLRTIINEEEQPNEAKPFLLAKRLNKACLNKTIIEERGKKPLVDLLESFGGWPVVKGDLWSEHSFDWVETIKKFRIFGLDTSPIFSFTVTTDSRNSTSRVCDVRIFHAI